MALSRIEGNPPCRMVRPWGFMQAWEPAPHRNSCAKKGVGSRLHLWEGCTIF